MKTLVIGSTGKTGRRILRRLTDLGHPVRGASRRGDPPFDWERQETWPAVLEGVGAAYVSYYSDLAAPEAPAAVEAFTKAAAAAGVQRLVLLSGRGEHHAESCEDIVRESGLGYTLVRASWFAQNFGDVPGGELRQGVMDGAVALAAGDVAEPFVDVEDIADVAVAALLDESHNGRVYDVTGPRLLTFASAVAEIAAAAGRPVAYVPVSVEELRAALAGHPQGDLFADLCGEVFDGRNANLGTGVQDALGRAPRDFADYCRAAAAAGAWR
ncbi:NmrA family NAD(P)-binding protein [Dactylosporangium sp. NPDC005555]|uniref:NmrA family NAD(P)-binding protein n=1 Tax=Dactylosporangium sp. NPDC005555 TaxID=3154889 RepID=UPI0033A1F4AD